jgi:hypothetical protein
MKLHTLALLGLALAVPTGWAAAEETTRVYRQGTSSATITQDGGGSTTVRRTTDGPDSQTIIQSQGGNRAAITQSSRRGMMRRDMTRNDMARSGPGPDRDMPDRDMPDRDMSEDMEDSVGRMQVVVSMSPEDREDLEALASEEETTLEALVEEAIQDFLDRNH